jgi:hypothetical protein
LHPLAADELWDARPMGRKRPLMGRKRKCDSCHVDADYTVSTAAVTPMDIGDASPRSEPFTSLQQDGNEAPDAISQRIDKRCAGIKGHEPPSDVAMRVARKKTHGPMTRVVHDPVHPVTAIGCANTATTINFNKPARR